MGGFYKKMLKAWQRLANDKVHTSWDYSIFRERWIKDCNSGENHPCKRPEVRERISKNRDYTDIKGERNPAKRLEVREKLSNGGIIQFDKNGIIVGEYKTLKEAEQYTKIHYQNIEACCNNIYKFAGEYFWRWKKEYIEKYNNSNKYIIEIIENNIKEITNNRKNAVIKRWQKEKKEMMN